MKKVAVFLPLVMLFNIAHAADSLTAPKPEIECVKLTKNMAVNSPYAKDKMYTSEVVLLQKFLAALGYFQSTPTGTYGKATELAVKAYQKKENITVTGTVGPMTRNSIYTKNCGKKQSGAALSIPSSSSSIDVLGATSKKDSVINSFTWRYKGNSYEINIPLSQTLYKAYSESPKVYAYKGKLPDNWTEEYNQMFLNIKQDDYTFESVASALIQLARKNNISSEETPNFILSFVQSIAYDFDKDLKKDHTQYPYETLFTKKGVCADKTFLAYQILKKAGYGVAILQFLDINHQAVGVRCPASYAVGGSLYCYAETTSYLPIGIIPTSFGASGDTGSVGLGDDFSSLFDTTRLGKIDVFVKTDGKLYDGVATVKKEVERLDEISKEIETTKTYIASSTTFLENKKQVFDDLRSQINTAVKVKDYDNYRALTSAFNQEVLIYQEERKKYESSVSLYNKDVKEYNELIKMLSQDK